MNAVNVSVTKAQACRFGLGQLITQHGRTSLRARFLGSIQPNKDTDARGPIGPKQGISSSLSLYLRQSVPSSPTRNDLPSSISALRLPVKRARVVPF